MVLFGVLILKDQYDSHSTDPRPFSGRALFDAQACPSKAQLVIGGQGLAGKNYRSGIHLPGHSQAIPRPLHFSSHFLLQKKNGNNHQSQCLMLEQVTSRPKLSIPASVWIQLTSAHHGNGWQAKDVAGVVPLVAARIKSHVGVSKIKQKRNRRLNHLKTRWSIIK